MKIRSCHDTDHLDELLLQNYYSLIKLFISSSKIMSSTSSAPWTYIEGRAMMSCSTFCAYDS